MKQVTSRRAVLARTGLVLSTALMLAGAGPPVARGVIFMSTADPEYNTTPPVGVLAQSGWDYEGVWGPFLGTAIAPHYFVTAHHVGGTVGEKFVLQGVEYTTTAVFDDSASDLRIWRVSGTLPIYADLYTKSDEVGKGLVVIGRGTQRGDPVQVDTRSGLQLKGWLWGTFDGRIRWGENRVDSIETGDQSASAPIGELLRASFSPGAGMNEAHLTFGDSSGAVFIQDGAKWKLAGINYGVDGPFNLTDSGSGFNAALFDEGGLYLESGGAWTLSPDTAKSQPSSFYATRVSAHTAWIQSILALTVAEVPVLQSAAVAAGPYTDETSVTVDSAASTVSLGSPAGTRFYRLRASTPITIKSIRIQSSTLILTYQ